MPSGKDRGDGRHGRHAGREAAALGVREAGGGAEFCLQQNRPSKTEEKRFSQTEGNGGNVSPADLPCKKQQKEFSGKKATLPKPGRGPTQRSSASEGANEGWTAAYVLLIHIDLAGNGCS